MRLKNEFRHGLKSPTSVRIAAAVGMSVALSSCGMFGADPYDSELVAASQTLPMAASNNPSSDYPLVVGAPYFVGDKEYAPEDTMNYDEVGFVDVDYSAGAGITGMHHTLPLPSYAEVTSLETGRTILVRIERRGPMESTQLLALSKGALAQLEAKAGDPVRVRRVNSQESERAMLRAGQSAPMRMDTPLSLAKVLKRKLPEAGAAPLMSEPARTAIANNNYQTPALPPVSTPAPPVKVARSGAGGQPSAPRYGRNNPAPTKAAAPALPPIGQKAAPKPARSAGEFEEAFANQSAQNSAPAPAASPVRSPAPARSSTAQVPRSGFVVQAIALSSASKANAVAKKISGQVTKSGKIYRVRTGPFSSHAKAQASLAKVRAAGYSDARIFTGG